MIQAGLVAANASIDFIGPVFRGLFDKIGIRQKGPGHGYHVGIPPRQHLFGHLGRVDAIAGYQGHGDQSFQFSCHPGKGRPRHRSGNGRHPGFVPSDAGIYDCHAGPFNFFCQFDDLLPGTSIFYQIDHGKPVNYNKVRSDLFPDMADNFNGKPNSILKTAAPIIGAIIGFRYDKLVYEVAF